jgi:hypothetical protein
MLIMCQERGEEEGEVTIMEMDVFLNSIDIIDRETNY